MNVFGAAWNLTRAARWAGGGSCMFGYDLVTELRDHMEITLREIMAKA